jgi:hypothetical protein
MSRQQKIHQVLAEHLIPEIGVHGEVWLAKDTQSFWYGTRDGRVVNLSDILNQVPVHAPPRHGRDGLDGRNGLDGAQGKIGPTGVGLPGVAGTGIPGPPGLNIKGDKGEPGAASTVPGPDSAVVLAEARVQIAAIRAEFADLKLQIQAVHEQNRQADAYLEFLRARRVARQK